MIRLWCRLLGHRPVFLDPQTDLWTCRCGEVTEPGVEVPDQPLNYYTDERGRHPLL